MPVCKTCGEDKPESEFYRDGRFLKGSCKPCYRAKVRGRRTPEEAAAYMRDWRARNPGYYRKRKDA